MKLSNKLESVAKLINLRNAFAECGIKAEVVSEDGTVMLQTSLWNGINGNQEPFTVFIEDDDTIGHFIEPETDRKEFSKILGEMIKNW